MILIEKILQFFKEQKLYKNTYYKPMRAKRNTYLITFVMPREDRICFHNVIIKSYYIDYHNLIKEYPNAAILNIINLTDI